LFYSLSLIITLFYNRYKILLIFFKMESKKQIIIYVFIILLVFFGIVFYNSKNSNSNLQIEESAVNIYYFWVQGCSYCAAESIWIKEMEEKYESINFLKLEANKNSGIFLSLLEKFDVSLNMRGSVPATFIGDKYFIGFNQEIGEEMEEKIKECFEEENCVNPLNK